MDTIQLTANERNRLALYAATINNAMQARTDLCCVIVERAGGDLAKYDYDLSPDGSMLTPRRKET